MLTHALAMCRYLLEHTVFYELLAFTDVETFEVASDAFLSFRELLTRHGVLTQEFLGAHGDEFFRAFNSQLLKSTNYVTRRQSLKLLGELLLTPGHVSAMMKYISDAGHLMLIMTLLRDPSRSIQFEAFHLLKVMIANPSKPQPVLDVLKSNGDRLQRFLSDFQADRDENDPDFHAEKQTLGAHSEPLGKNLAHLPRTRLTRPACRVEPHSRHVEAVIAPPPAPGGITQPHAPL